MGYTILNDIHLSAKRQGGTTPESQERLKAYLQERFSDLVSTAPDGDTLIIAGDLFDAFEVDPRDVLLAYETLSRFLLRGSRLVLIQGNHDATAKGGKLSSFHLLSHLLASRFQGQVQVIDQGLTEIGVGVWAIPHVVNQDIYDMELNKAITLDTPTIRYLILHANFDNKFTLSSDHSLNVSIEQAESLTAAGVTILFAHEHQAKSAMAGSVQIMGNQIASSVADCLGNVEKFAWRLEDD